MRLKGNTKFESIHSFTLFSYYSLALFLITLLTSQNNFAIYIDDKIKFKDPINTPTSSDKNDLSYKINTYKEDIEQFSDQEIIEQYLDYFDHMVTKICVPGVRKDFEKYFNLISGNGFKLPLLNEREGEIDLEAIQKVLPLFPIKINWIESKIIELKQNSSISFQKEMQAITGNIEELLKYKYEFVLAREQEVKNKIEFSSANELKKLKNNYKSLISKISFLTNFSFPVNHLELRRETEEIKNRNDLQSIRLRNFLFLKRKLIEDGMELKHKKRNNDRYLRALLSSIYLRLEEGSFSFLSEDLRYDLDSVLQTLNGLLKTNKQKDFLRSLEDWKQSTKKSYEFYKSIVVENDPYLNAPINLQKSKLKFKEIARKRFLLKDFSYLNQLKVYQYWSKLPTLFQALFTFDTILFNEVGFIDSKEGAERKDISQLVFNRGSILFYSSILSNDSFFPYLKSEYFQDEEKSEHLDFPWLNILFKEGEFSFTYYFIHHSINIYCPLRTKQVRKLQLENLKIALNTLRNPRSDFKATRFFSRHAMLGRIDMGRIWKFHKPLEEQTGKRAGTIKHFTTQNRVSGKKSNSLKFKNSFYDRSSNLNLIFEVQDFLKNSSQKGNVVINYSQIQDSEDEELDVDTFKYRNPHHFRYFENIGKDFN